MHGLCTGLVAEEIFCQGTPDSGRDESTSASAFLPHVCTRPLVRKCQPNTAYAGGIDEGLVDASATHVQSDPVREHTPAAAATLLTSNSQCI